MGQIQGGYRGPDIVSDGLVLYLDAGSPNSYRREYGDTWRDISGNGKNGTLTGGPTFNSANGGSINFDGDNDYAVIGKIDNTTDFTLAGWFIHPNSSFVQYNNLISKDINTIQRVYQISLNFDNLQCHLPTNSQFFGGTVSPNVWYYYTFTSSNANGRRLYLNATLNGSAAGAIAASTASVDVTLHTYFSLDNRTGNIRIATTQIYNRELSGTEITQNFNALRGRFGV